MGKKGCSVLEEASEEGFLFAARVGFFGRDGSVFDEFKQRIVHEFHSLFASGLDHAWEHERFSVPDEVADGCGVGEDFEGEDATCSIGSRDELLGDDAAEGFADHDADLVALIGGEDVEDAIEGSGGVTGVEGAEHEVPGF